jgi:hypothetical protein
MRWITAFVSMVFLAAGWALKDISDPPALSRHTDQTDLEDGGLAVSEALDRGAELFRARFNLADGQGRPGATGDAKPTKRLSSTPRFIRTSAPDANSCLACHNQPLVGGGGDFAANVFVLAQFLDPPTDSVSVSFSNERNSPPLTGTGAIEMLAREMTAELLSIRNEAEQSARRSGVPVRRELRAKSVSFGAVTVRPDGVVDGREIEGVDPDLVVKPFSAKGVVISLREFTINALNHHHGMQAVERFGWPRTGQADFDEDGVAEELTIGDVTVLSLFQAALPIPTRVPPTDPRRAAAASRGESLFGSIGCTECHRPLFELQSRNFSEPNPYNRPGNLRPEHVEHPVEIDLTREGFGTRLEPGAGGAVIRPYTDLKRHRICDADDPFYCNETLVQDNVPVDQFLTSRLWDVGSSAPYGHRGDLTTLTEAIVHHSGEARSARERFQRLGAEDRRAIVAFLLTLQIDPDDTLAVLEPVAKRGGATAHTRRTK